MDYVDGEVADRVEDSEIPSKLIVFTYYSAGWLCKMKGCLTMSGCLVVLFIDENDWLEGLLMIYMHRFMQSNSYGY